MANTLFYDGNCPICAKEIKLLSKFMDQQLILQNIHSGSTSVLAKPHTKSELMAVLHLKTAQGEWLKGLDATVAAWRHTPFGFIFAPLRWPVLRSVSDYFYYRWAAKRVCAQTEGSCDATINSKV